MGANHTAIATCHQQMWDLTVISDGCCPINVEYDSFSSNVTAGGNHTFEEIPCCTEVTLTADDTEPCCVFDSWSDAGAKSHSFHMDSDKTVIAHCSEVPTPTPSAPDVKLCEGYSQEDLEAAVAAAGGGCNIGTPTITDNSDGTYTVECDNQGCTASAIGTITVFASCKATADNFSICQSKKVDKDLFKGHAKVSAGCEPKLDISNVRGNTPGTYPYTVTCDCPGSPCEPGRATGMVKVVASCVPTAPDFTLCLETPLNRCTFVWNGVRCCAGWMMSVDYSDVDIHTPGSYNYTVTCYKLEDGVCGPGTATGTVTVTADCKATADDFSIPVGTTVDDDLFAPYTGRCEGCTTSLDYTAVDETKAGEYPYTVTRNTIGCGGVEFCVDVATGTVAVVTEAGEPSLSITKTDSPDPVAPGGTLTYEISVENTGAAEATGVVVKDDYDGSVLTITDADGGVDADGKVTWDVGTIAAGDSVTYTVIATVDAGLEDGDIISNTASVSCTEGAEDTTSIETEVSVPGEAGEPSLSITKTDSPDPVAPGGTLTYEITVENTGDAEAAGVIVEDDYDESVVTITDADAGVDAGGKVTWDVGTIAAGDSVTYTVIATVDAGLEDGDIISNTASVSCTEGAEDTTSIETEVSVPGEAGEPSLSITKTDSPDPVAPGGTLTYEITVENTGDAEATGVVVEDDCDENVLTITDADGKVDVDGKITWNAGTIAAGDSVTYTVIATVDAGLEDGDIISNTASVSCTEGSEDTTSIETEVSLGLSVSKTDSADPVDVGDTLTYTITITNSANATANKVTVTETYDANFGFSSADPAPDEGTNDQWTFASIGAGATETITITGTVLENGQTSLTNTVSYTSDNAGDGGASEDTKIAEEATVLTVITGVTGEVDCSILGGVTVELFKDGLPQDSTTSESGDYTLAASISETGTYTVVASKSGFNDETQSINITELGQQYELNFRAETGLIPNAPDAFYVLECVNHWLYPESSCGLSVFKALEVVNAWLYPA